MLGAEIQEKEQFYNDFRYRPTALIDFASSCFGLWVFSEIDFSHRLLTAIV
jgi:hypothetical protein